MHRIFASLILLCATFVVAPLAALATPITVPTGLNPGDQYRLVFVTSTTRNAASSDIEVYNDFVTGVANSVQALSDLGTTWKAIASTASIDARDNTSTNFHASVGIPIYRLDGGLVATSNLDLWNGSITNPINVNEFGGSTNSFVWTGTGSDGVVSAGHALASLSPVAGESNLITGLWIGFNNFGPNSGGMSFYAISGVLTAVPEPSTMVLACLAAAALAVPSLRRRRHCET